MDQGARSPVTTHSALNRYPINGDDSMTTYEQLYLAMVILAFVTFGIMLATMSYRQGQK